MAKHFEHVDDICARWQRRYARRGLWPVARRRVDWRRYQRALRLLFVLSMFLPGTWSVAKAEPQQVFRDASGRTIGTATRNGNMTTFRDAGGRTTGTATTDSRGTTTFRDAGGRTTGTTTRPGTSRSP
jgi:hypothetical protein